MYGSTQSNPSVNFSNSKTFPSNEQLVSSQESLNDTSPFLTDIDREKDNEEEQELHFEGQNSLFEVGMNVGNTIVGSGIIGLPSALNQAGFVLGILLLALVSVLTVFSLKLLVKVGVKTRQYHYPDLFEFVFGKAGFYVVNLVLLLNSGGGCVSYLIIVGDTIPKVLGYYFPDTFLGDRRLMVFLCSMIFVLPLVLFREVGKLAKASMLSVLCIPFIVIAVAVQSFTGPSYARDDVEYTFANPGFFPAIGTMAFAYVCHQAAFLHFRSLKVPTMRNWVLSSGLGVLVATVLSMVFAIVGYCAFGEETKGNILENFPEDDLVINIARIFLAITMFLTFPFAFAVIRLSANKILRLESEEKVPTLVQHLAVTLTLFAIVVVLGIFLTDLGVVYEIIGGLCSVSIAYILPAAAFLRIFGVRLSSALVLLLLVFGLVAMVASTGTVIYELIAGEP